MVLGTGGLRGGNRPERPVRVEGCAANPKAGWAGRMGTGVHLPLETEEAQKGAGQGISASRNALDTPSPRRPSSPDEVSEEGGAEEAEASASGRRAGAELQSISGEAAFYGCY